MVSYSETYNDYSPEHMQNLVIRWTDLKTPVALLVLSSTSPMEPNPPSPERSGVGSVASTLLMTAMPDPSTASKEGMPQLYTCTKTELHFTQAMVLRINRSSLAVYSRYIHQCVSGKQYFLKAESRNKI